MTRTHCAVLIIALISLSACHAQTQPAPSDAASNTDQPASGELVLSDDQVQRLGVQIQALGASTHLAEVVGYGAVLSRLSLTGAIAEAGSADSAAQHSRAALARAQALANTAGAFSTDAEQTVERQATADEAAAALADSRLEATIGAPDADVGQRQRLLQQLQRGEVQLIRVTFPLQTLAAAVPARLQIEPLEQSLHRSWPAARVWPAPADPSFPGRSLFALLAQHPLADGERVLTRAAQGPSQAGVVVPASAVVIYDAHYWCYTEGQHNHFRRVQLSADSPTDGGYFVSDGLHAGDRVVTQAAALLLSQQTGIGDAAD